MLIASVSQKSFKTVTICSLSPLSPSGLPLSPCINDWSVGGLLVHPSLLLMATGLCVPFQMSPITIV